MENLAYSCRLNSPSVPEKETTNKSGSMLNITKLQVSIHMTHTILWTACY